jgi:predicted dehydrogenase
MGGNHAKAWAARPDTRLAAVFDPDPARCRSVAEVYGAVACDTAEAAVRTPGVNVASVCSPVCYHRELSELALRAGCHVLCEKPIALTAADARAMTDCATAQGRLLGVSYQYRSQPGYERARDLIRAGALGTPIMARFVDVRHVRPKLAMHSRSMNGGPLIDMAGHYFDLMRCFTGEEARQVYARGHVYGRGKPSLATIDDLAIDAAELVVDYTGGHVLSVLVHWGLPEGHPGFTDSSIVGPEATIRGLPDQLHLAYTDRVENHRLPQGAWGPASRIADLVSAIRGESALAVDGEAGCRALAVSLAALESIETGRAVEVVTP